MAMAKRIRLTKATLIKCGYYEWLKMADQLHAKKKAGAKLTSQEKAVLRSKPRPEMPYNNTANVKESTVDEPERKKNRVKLTSNKIEFGLEKVFETSGWGSTASFACEVFDSMKRDEDCLLMCRRSDCPFHEKGYFRSKGVKF